MQSDIPVIILAEPQMGENIGAAARAMLNFGLMDLRIVSPRDGWPNPAAEQNASGALDIITPQIFPTLADALADLNYVYATTARPRDVAKPVRTPREAIRESRRRQGKTGFVFGRERTGLENDDISLCHAIVSAQVNPEFASLNLGQAVLMIAYEWMAAENSNHAQEMPGHLPAAHKDLLGLMTRLEQELEAAQFYKTEGNKPVMIRNLRALLARANMSDQEVRTFHGIITALREGQK